MPNIAPTLECRLLSASGCAYAVDGGGSFTPPQPYYDAVGFKDAPTAIAGGPGKINACLVGENGDGIVVAFRGTLPADIHDLPSLMDWMDWMQNFDAVAVGVAGIPGKVHSGFWRGLDTLWDDVLAAVKKRKPTGGAGRPLYITGHSKGGGLAHLAAMRFLAAGITPTEVFTFAAPRAGNGEFAAAYNQAVSAFRYEYRDDIVPHLPPDLQFVSALRNLPVLGERFREVPAFDYADVGTLRFIDWDNRIVGESELLKVRRLVHLAMLIVEGSFSQMGADHDHACGSGYLSQVCPGVCPST